MLNIRINLAIDLKKVAAILATFVLLVSHIMTPPAQAVEVKMTPIHEQVVTVSLTHLKVTTTRSAALKALKSPGAKYFDAEALAFLTTYTQGWGRTEWRCLQYIWTQESHFNPLAVNPHSGAYGIAQFMPPTWKNYKVKKTSDPRLQIKYGLHYIKIRYGSACHAKYFWIKHHWY